MEFTYHVSFSIADKSDLIEFLKDLVVYYKSKVNDNDYILYKSFNCISFSDDYDTIELSSLELNKIQNNYKKSENKLNELFKMLRTPVSDYDEKQVNVNKSYSDNAIDFLYMFNIEIDNDLYEIEEDEANRIIYITLKDNDTFVLEKLKMSEHDSNITDYKLIFKTKSKTTKNGPVFIINDVIMNTDMSDRLKQMIDYKDNYFSTVQIPVYSNTKQFMLKYLKIKNMEVKVIIKDDHEHYKTSADDYVIAINSEKETIVISKENRD